MLRNLGIFCVVASDQFGIAAFRIERADFLHEMKQVDVTSGENSRRRLFPENFCYVRRIRIELIETDILEFRSP